MKIKRFNENIENKGDIYLITENNPYGENYTFLFNSYKNSCDFMIYAIYDKLDDNDLDIGEFEKECDFDDLEQLIQYYNDITDIKYESSISQFENTKFEDWMIERMEAKKYNL